MNPGLFEIALLAGSITTAFAGAAAAVARRRSGILLASNATFAACFGYFAIQGLRFGGIIVGLLGVLALIHLALASMIVRRARRRAPTA